ncbi:hypothetical protein M2277_004972 [Paenibacillus sp. LBL]|nr:hypothetical protein [Paenibacillus sp. LBL]
MGLNTYRWYRRMKGGSWFRVTHHALPGMSFWVNDPLNYDVIDFESWYQGVNFSCLFEGREHLYERSDYY